jgi:hypothetical protein
VQACQLVDGIPSWFFVVFAFIFLLACCRVHAAARAFIAAIDSYDSNEGAWEGLLNRALYGAAICGCSRRSISNRA